MAGQRDNQPGQRQARGAQDPGDNVLTQGKLSFKSSVQQFK